MERGRRENSGGSYLNNGINGERLKFFDPLDVYLYQELDPKFILDPKYERILREELGGKGYGLAIMTAMGLNIPSGYTLPIRHGNNLYETNYQQLPDSLETKISKITMKLTNDKGARFGDPNNPLAVAARSGAIRSMPGTMHSILYIGFAKNTIDAFVEKLGADEAWKCFHVFCFGWVASKLNINKNNLENKIEQLTENSKPKTTLQYQQEIDFLESWLQEEHQLIIPQTPDEQLCDSILSIYGSYHSPEAIKYRQAMGITEENGSTAVNVLSMVYGNQGEICGSGVVFSHDPKTGEDRLQIEYAPGGIGEVVVAGTGNGFEQEIEPKLQVELEEVIERLVQLTGGPVDVEFVIENGKLYFVQYRGLRLTTPAILKKTMKSLVLEHQDSLSPEQIMILREKIDPSLIADLAPGFTKQSLNKSLNNENTNNIPRLIVKGQPIGGQVRIGKVATSLEEAEKIIKKENVVLILEQLQHSSQILQLDEKSEHQIAVITLDGSPNSHAANILGTANIVGAIGCRDLPINKIKDGMELSVDGTTGEVHLGRLSIAQLRIDKKTKNLINQRKEMGINAWESFVHKFGLKEELYGLETKIEKITKSFINGDGIKSAKALTQKIINHIFPKKFSTEYHILSVDEENPQSENSYKDEIYAKVHQGWKNGHDVSIRSAFSFKIKKDMSKLGNGPWIMLKPGEEERLEQFLFGELENWKYGSLAAWKRNNENKDIKLTEVLVGFNHSGKLDEDLADQHAVGVINSTISSKDTLNGSIVLDTPHLRSYEEKEYDSNQNVTYKINLNQNNPQAILGFGENHINHQALDKLIKKLKTSISLSPQEKAIKKEILEKLGIDELQNLSENELNKQVFKPKLIKLIESGNLPTTLLKQVVIEKNWNKINQLTNKLITEYIEAVVPGLAAVENWLSRITGDIVGVTIEYQAGFNDDGSLAWLTVYGLKGLEEALLALDTNKAS